MKSITKLVVVFIFFFSYPALADVIPLAERADTGSSSAGTDQVLFPYKKEVWDLRIYIYTPINIAGWIQAGWITAFPKMGPIVEAFSHGFRVGVEAAHDLYRVLSTYGCETKTSIDTVLTTPPDWMFVVAYSKPCKEDLTTKMQKFKTMEEALQRMAEIPSSALGEFQDVIVLERIKKTDGSLKSNFYLGVYRRFEGPGHIEPMERMERPTP